MLKLRRLKIHQFRSVAPGTELVFNDGFNIVLGKNGSGKTTLLKLIAGAVSSSFAGAFAGEALHVEYVYTLGALQLRAEVKQEDTSEAWLPRAFQTSQERDSIFTAQVSHTDHSDPLEFTIEGDRLTVTYQGASHSRKISAVASILPSFDLTFAAAAVMKEASKLPPTYAPLYSPERLAHRFDEALEWIRSALEDLRVTFGETDTEEDWCEANTRYTGASALFKAALAEYRGAFSRLPEVLSLHGERMPLLREASERLSLGDVSLHMSLVEQSPLGFKQYGRIQAYATTRAGARFPLEHLSFGQLRLFGFIFYAAMHPHVIIADELTNGLHHAMIDACIDTIGERQAFLATQNPLLLDHLGFESTDEVRRTFLLCDLRDGPDGQQTMVWRNMTTDEADDFFKDYQVGIQHVNDILRTRGLW